MTANTVQEAFRLKIESFTELTLHQFGLLLFYLLIIVFVVNIFTELYMDTHEINIKERFIMVGLGFSFGLLDMWVGDSRIFIPVWGILAYLFVVDAKYQELPDRANLAVAILALPVVVYSFLEPSYWNWTILTGLFLFLFFVGISMVGALGGGDIKMMGAIGLYFPLMEVPQLLVFGFGVGVLHAVVILFKKGTNLQTKFAFGPGLIIGVLLASIF